MTLANPCTDQDSAHGPSPAAGPFGTAARRLAGRIQAYGCRRARARTARKVSAELAELPAHMLCDLGVYPAELGRAGTPDRQDEVLARERPANSGLHTGGL